jgi:large subunit ribosomal protein L23
MTPYEIIIRPVVTEKSTMLAEQNKYVFEVAEEANKIEVARAIAEIFKVDVLDVNMIRVPGKLRRVGRSRGRTKPWKKAIVTLAAGQRIELFPT